MVAIWRFGEGRFCEGRQGDKARGDKDKGDKEKGRLGTWILGGGMSSDSYFEVLERYYFERFYFLFVFIRASFVSISG